MNPEPANASAGRRILSGVFANILGQGVTVFNQLLLVPLFLGSWGKQMYGEWLLLSAGAAYFAICDFGIQMFVVNRMNQCHSRREFPEVTRILQSALLCSLVFSFLAFAIFLPLAAFADLQKWLRLTLTGNLTAAVVAGILILQVVALVPYGVLAGLYRAVGEYPRGQMIQNSYVIASLAFTLLALSQGGRLVAVALAQAAAVVAAASYVLWDLRTRHPNVEIGLRKADFALAMSFLGPSLLFFLIQTSVAFVLHGTTLILGSLYGAALVAVFVPHRTLANLVRQTTSAMTNSLWPEITAGEARSGQAALQARHVLVAKALVVLTLATASFLRLAGADLLRLWTRGRIEYQPALMNALLVLLVAQALWLGSALILAAINQHRRLAWCHLSAAVAGLTLGYWMATRFGPPGLFYGLCIADLLICGIIVPVTACRLAGQSVAGFLGQVWLKGALLGGPVFGLVLELGTTIRSESAPKQIAFALLLAAVGTVAFALTFFSREEKHWLTRLLQIPTSRLAVQTGTA